MSTGNDPALAARLARIALDPRYQALIKERTRLGWCLSAAIFIAFIAFILLIAFDKALLARPVGAGVTSLGIPVGFGLIAFAIALTGVYVLRANQSYDARLRDILAEEGA